jgi:uncharacterized membrane protein
MSGHPAFQSFEEFVFLFVIPLYLTWFLFEAITGYTRELVKRVLAKRGKEKQ